MKLNEEGRKELRKRVVELLKNVPEGKKIKLNSDVLDDLLFKTINFIDSSSKERGKLKLPIWSGEFLRKLDLSEVSFEDVSWTLLNNAQDPFTRYYSCIDEATEEKLKEVIPNLNSLGIEYVDYSGTNANINLNKSFEYKADGFIHILDCNFSGVNLSDNDFTDAEVYNSNLSYTNIKLSPETFSGSDTNIRETNLTGIDLSKFSYNLSDIIIDEDRDDKKCRFDLDCDFTNTGISFTNANKNNFFYDDGDNAYEDYCDIIPKFMSKLKGCYVNGEYIKNLDDFEKEKKKQQLENIREDYETYKQDLFNSVEESIKNQSF